MFTTSSKLFDLTASSNRFDADISTLLWDCFPNSFVMKSHRTGVEKTFHRDVVHRDPDGDILFIRYNSDINGVEYHAYVYND